MSLKPKNLPIRPSELRSTRSLSSTGGIDWYLEMKNVCCRHFTHNDRSIYQVGDVKIALQSLSTCQQQMQEFHCQCPQWRLLSYTQLSLSLSASISGVLALIISSGSRLSSLTQLRLSWRELGENRFRRMARLLLRLSRLSMALKVSSLLPFQFWWSRVRGAESKPPHVNPGYSAGNFSVEIWFALDLSSQSKFYWIRKPPVQTFFKLSRVSP